MTGNVIHRSGNPEWGKDDDYDNTHARFENVQGLVFSGNAMKAGKGDSGKGEWSPDYSIVIHRLENSVIKDNVMHEGSMRELLIDRGEHGPNVIVKDNVGSLKQL